MNSLIKTGNLFPRRAVTVLGAEVVKVRLLCLVCPKSGVPLGKYSRVEIIIVLLIMTCYIDIIHYGKNNLSSETHLHQSIHSVEED